MRRRKSLVLAVSMALTVTAAPQVACAHETPWHGLISAVARRPEQQFFSQHWTTIWQNAKAPDRPREQLSEAAEPGERNSAVPSGGGRHKSLDHALRRWERCEASFNASTRHYRRGLQDSRESQQAAETLGCSMHYLQDNVAPRKRRSWQVHLEMANQARDLLVKEETAVEVARAEAAQRRFYQQVDDLKAALQSRGYLTPLFHKAGHEQREQAEKLSAAEADEFRTLAIRALAAAVACTENAYELYLARVAPAETDLKWNFVPEDLRDALEGVDEKIREVQNRDGQHATTPSTEDEDSEDADERYDEVAAVGASAGPAEIQFQSEVVVREFSDEQTIYRHSHTNIATHETRTEGSDDLLPVVARGGPWTVRAEGGVLTLSAITFTIEKNGTATLSACRFQARPLIERADVRFRAATRSDIHVAPDRPEIRSFVNQLQRSMSELDSDGNGVLEWKEFFSAVQATTSEEYLSLRERILATAPAADEVRRALEVQASQTPYPFHLDARPSFRLNARMPGNNLGADRE